MKFACLLPIVCASFTRAAIADVPNLCASTPEIVERAFIPSAARRHGEVRLVATPPCAQAGCSECSNVEVETLLFSTMLARGLHRIRQEESRACPPGSVYHQDSVRYLAALDAAAESVLGPAPGPVDVNQPVQAAAKIRRMSITFSERVDSGVIVISIVELGPTEGDGPVSVLSSTLLQRIVVDGAYVRSSAALMVGSAFGLDTHAAELCLAQALHRAGLLKKE